MPAETTTTARSADLRKSFYENFARKANEAGVAWAVLSGIDGYPESIGRDLDVTCRSRQDADRLCAIFVDCMKAHDFRWIVYPSPIWGRRIMGITADYRAVELHVVIPVQVASIALQPDWSAIEYAGGLFPTNALMRFFKRCLTPALARSGGWIEKCAQMRLPPDMPWWLRPVAKKLQAGRELTNWDRASLSASHFLVHPLRSIRGVVRWRVRRGVRRGYPAAPVYQLAGLVDPEEFRDKARQTLGEVFTGVICVDEWSPKRIKANQAVQRLVFLTTERPDVPDARRAAPSLETEEKLMEFLVEEFCRFNERWRPKA